MWKFFTIYLIAINLVFSTPILAADHFPEWRTLYPKNPEMTALVETFFSHKEITKPILDEFIAQVLTGTKDDYDRDYLFYLLTSTLPVPIQTGSVINAFLQHHPFRDFSVDGLDRENRRVKKTIRELAVEKIIADDGKISELPRRYGSLFNGMVDGELMINYAKRHKHYAFVEKLLCFGSSLSGYWNHLKTYANILGEDLNQKISIKNYVAYVTYYFIFNVGQKNTKTIFTESFLNQLSATLISTIPVDERAQLYAREKHKLARMEEHGMKSWDPAMMDHFLKSLMQNPVSDNQVVAEVSLPQSFPFQQMTSTMLIKRPSPTVAAPPRKVAAKLPVSRVDTAAMLAEIRSRKKPPHCIIDTKYLEMESTPHRPFTEKGITALNHEKHELLPVENFFLPPEAIHHLDVLDGTQTILSTQASIDEWRTSPRLTFVRNGRGKDALVPRESDGGRVVLVMPKSEENAARALVGEHQDVLLINSDPLCDDYDLGLAGVRWLAVFRLAFALELKNFMLMDDNIDAVYTKQRLHPSWQAVYQTYESVASTYNAALMSTTTYNQLNVDQMLVSDHMRAIYDSYGYKLFFIDIAKVKTRISNVINLIPPKPSWPLQDIFLQEVLRQSGVRIAKMSPESLVITRAHQKSNCCAHSYAQRNISARAWLSTDVSHYPSFYQAAAAHLATLVTTSIAHHEKNQRMWKTADLATLQPPAELRFNSPVRFENHNELYSAMSSRDLLQQSISHIDQRDFRVPQINALKNLEQFLTSDGIQGFFAMPTGTGKTKIFSQIATHYSTHAASISKPIRQPHVLIVTPSIELGGQIYAQDLPKDRTIIINSKNISQQALRYNDEFKLHNSRPKIVVMCKNSLKNLLAQPDHHLVMNMFGLIIVDEMHLVSRKVLRSINDHSTATQTVTLGFSATPSSATEFLPSQIYYYSPIDAVKDGLLSPWKIKWQTTDAFTGRQATYKTIETIIANLSELDGGFNHRGIIWVPSIKRADNLATHIASRFPQLKNQVAAYHMNIANRAALLNELKENHLKILIAVRTLKEGFDHRDLDFAIVGLKKVSMDDFIQIRGRIVRISDQPKVAKIYVAAGAVEITSPSQEQLLYCPQACFSPKQSLSSSWNVIPFPIRTDLARAITYAQRLMQHGSSTDFFAHVQNEIYHLPNARERREYFRWVANYKQGKRTLEGLYYHYFIENSDMLDIGQKPRVNVYIEQVQNGEKRYQLIGSEAGMSSQPPLNILKKTRQIYNKKTCRTENVNHYELLMKFGTSAGAITPPPICRRIKPA